MKNKLLIQSKKGRLYSKPHKLFDAGIKRNIFLKSMVLVLLLLFAASKSEAQVNLNNGLIASLPLNGNGTDESGNGNHASSTGSQTFWGVDRFMNFPGAMRFIGENGQAKMTFGTPVLSNQTEFTVSFWVMMTEGVSGQGMNIFGQDNLLEVAYYLSPNQFRIYHPTSGSFNINLTSPYYNVWRHILITGNSTEMKTYLNGTLVNTQTGNFSLGNNTNETNIGGHVLNQTTTAWLRGSVDNLRIYSRVLTTDEINALYNDNHPAIVINSVNATSFCAGDNLQVDFSVTGSIQSDNIYYLQMSGPTGSFAIPVTIGKLVTNNLTGIFNTVIPSGTPSGTGYKFRVVSTNISATSNETSAITINGVLGDIPSASDYIFIGNVSGKNYYLSTASSGGGTAQNTSVTNGGYLATVYDSTSNVLMHFTASHMESRLYIGLNDITTEGTHVWRNDQPLTYINWGTGQPDNASNEDYTEIRGDNGQWNDITNTKTQRHIMELKPAGINQTFCLGDNIQLNGATLSGGTYQWTGPDGFSSSLQNPLILNGQGVNAGNYTLTYTLGACSSSDVVAVNMNSLPPGSLVDVIKDSICSGENGIVFVLNSDPDITYQLKDGVTATNIGAAQTGNNDTLFFSTGALTTTSTFDLHASFTSTGCETIIEDIVVNVRAIPASPTVLGDEVCNHGELTLTASGGNFYNWYTTPTGGTPLLGVNGNTITIDTNVTVNYYVSHTDIHGCESGRTNVTGTVINPLNPPVDIITGLILHYKFDNNLADSSGYNYNGTVFGTNSYVNDRNGNPNAALNSISTSIPGGNYISAGNPAKIQQLTNQVTISMWIYQQQSWFGDGVNTGHTPLVNKWDGSTGMYMGLIAHTPGNPQNKVRWRVNGATALNSTVNVPLAQWVHIVCTYNGAQLRIYQNGVLTGTLNYTGTISNTGVNMLIGRQANIPGEITFRGNYDQLRIYNRALNLSEVQTLYNNESVAFADSPLCDGEDNLTLSTFNFPGATYSWNGPNGFTSTQQNPPVISNADSATYAGLYTLQVTVNGCTSPIQPVNVVIHEIPSAPATINDTVCGSGNAVLTASGAPAGASYNWYTAAVGGTPISGQHSATLTISSVTTTTSRYVSIVRNGCEGPRAEVIAVYYNNVATGLTVTGSSVCENETTATVTILSSETNVNYQAFSGATAISSVVSGGGTIVLNVNTSTMNIGNNTVTIQANYPSCGPINLTNTATVTLLALPSVTITPSPSLNFCTGDNVDLTASNASAYLWSTGETTQTINVDASGTFSVTITDANGCENATNVITNEISLPTPSISASGSTTICSGESVTLIASGGDTYLWSTGETTTTIEVTVAGNYNFTAFNTNCSAISSDITITVLPLPTVTAQASATTICSGEQVILTGAGADNYVWDNSVMDGISFVPSSTQTYSVIGTDVNGCSSSDMITVTVNPLPDAGFTSDLLVFCTGTTSVTLTADDLLLTNYDWYESGNPVNLNGPSSISVTSAGNYELTVTDNNGCENSSQLIIGNSSVNTSSVTGNTVVSCSGSNEVYSVTNTVGSTYNWMVPAGATITSGQGTNTITVDFNGNFGIVSVIETNSDGCIGASQDITVICTNGIEESDLSFMQIYPNPTTGVFVIDYGKNERATLEIFDITGKLVLKSEINTGATVSLQDVERGSYIGRLKSGDEFHVFHIVKN